MGIPVIFAIHQLLIRNNNRISSPMIEKGVVEYSLWYDSVDVSVVKMGYESSFDAYVREVKSKSLREFHSEFPVLVELLGLL